MGEMLKRIFIDTNVFVHWILYKKISEDRPIDKSQMWVRYSRYKSDYEFIEQIHETHDKTAHYFTSDLAIAEIVFSIYREIKFRKMYLDGVPFSAFVNKIVDSKSFVLEQGDIEAIRGLVFLFLQQYDIFNKPGEKRKVQLLHDEHDFLLISELVIKENIRTQDSILTSTAVSAKCDYFVTSDIELKKLNKSSIKELKGLEFLSPNEIEIKLKSSAL